MNPLKTRTSSTDFVMPEFASDEISRTFGWVKPTGTIKHAPHTQFDVCADEWDRPYSRQVAAFPLPWIAERGKFWPSVGRVDNAYGDKHIKLTLDT